MATAGTETSTLTLPSDREIRYERVLDAPVELVWRAFTEPRLLKRWWARGNKMDVERLEVLRGGHWRFVEHAPEGRQGFEGRFREIVPKERIVETFEWDGLPGYVSLDTAEFEPLADGRTRFVETSVYFSPEERDGMIASGMEEGLERSLTALDNVLEKLK